LRRSVGSKAILSGAFLFLAVLNNAGRPQRMFWRFIYLKLIYAHTS
jgi:hypothetical protein